MTTNGSLKVTQDLAHRGTKENDDLNKVDTTEAISALAAQAVIKADQEQRCQHTLAEMKKIFDAYQTDITVVMTLRPGQYPVGEIQVVAK